MINLGFLCPGESPSFRVRVRNVGGGALKLGEVAASCGCTDLELPIRHLPPGKETELRGRVRLSLKEEVFNHVVWIMDAGGKNRLGQVFLRGRATWPVQANAEVLHLGRIPLGRRVRTAFQVYSAQRAPFEILSIEASAPHVRIARHRMHQGRANVTIEVDALSVGEIDEVVTVRTSHPQRPLLMIAVKGAVCGDVWLASHHRVFLGLRKPGERVERPLVLGCAAPELCQVTGVWLDAQDWQLAEWHCSNHPLGRTAVLRIAFVVPERPGNHKCTLHVVTASGISLTADVSCIVEANDGGKLSGC
ncbi:MAG: DUF1573 domain-containing protein [Pirellulales bacterium]|nr:DUF1573 domain-containing protein [Pirellulales bacterium]